MKLWKLKDDGVMTSFKAEFEASCIKSKGWNDLKISLLGVVGEVCGYTKGKVRDLQTWW